MKRYLLDSNICIFLLQGKFNLPKKIDQIGTENCFISEITVAELKFGAENSPKPELLRLMVEKILQQFQVIPIYDALDIYAQEKARLRKAGREVDDFDLLIGATAIVNECIMVTQNKSHFSRISNIEIEDWTHPDHHA